MNGIVSFIYYDRKVKTRRYNEYLRDVMDPFNISERCFIDNYRLPKNMVHELISEINEFVDDTDNALRIPLHLEVLASLNFMASGSHQRRVGMDAFATMSQSKISLSIRRITKIIGSKLVRRYINFPATISEALTKKEEFMDKFGVPGIVGLIDCTHVAIAKINKKDEYAYVNRKNFHSINVQVICDLNLQILSLNARYPGSTHDSLIWQGSIIQPVLQQLNFLDNHTWLFGDSGYALKSFMMVPYRHQPLTDAQRQFNKKHAIIRSGVERCFGLLKSRFRCLKMASGHLHYDHERTAQIIHSCAVLHNLLINNNYPIDDIELDDEIIPSFNIEADSYSGELNRNFLTNYMIKTNINI